MQTWAECFYDFKLLCDQISIVRWHTRAEARVEIGKDKKFFFFSKTFFVCYTSGYDMGYLPIFVENMVVLGIIFFINLWWFFLLFIRRNVCYHLQRTFLMWFDKIPLVGVQSGSLYFSGNNKTIRYDFGGKKYIYPNLPIVLKQ